MTATQNDAARHPKFFVGDLLTKQQLDQAVRHDHCGRTLDRCDCFKVKPR